MPTRSPHHRRADTALCIIAALYLSGCAAERQQLKASPARHISALEGLEIEEAQPWAPSALYPTLDTDEQLQQTLTQDQREGKRALAARADQDASRLAQTPHASKGAMMAGAWFVFQGYKQTLSRLDGNRCGFTPSCSRFGYQALAAHGPITGVGMTFARLMRNHAEHDFYLNNPQGYLRDPLSNYTFFSDEPAPDTFWRYDDPAQGWYMHVKATTRFVPARQPSPSSTTTSPSP